jgi:hypothetical protein
VKQQSASEFAAELEKVGAIRGHRARWLARKMLNADPDAVPHFLKLVETNYGKRVAQALGDVFVQWVCIERRGQIND